MTAILDAPALEFDDFAVTGPGVYDIPEDVYHADPVPGGSLSSSGARRLLATCPALFDYERRHRRQPTEAMEFGTAAHHRILGTGAEIVEIDADDYRSKAAQQAKAEARARGAVPMLPKELAVLGAMEQALRAHPLASTLLTQWGRAEQSAFWRDKASGVICRARYDILPTEPTVLGRLIVPDYKTAKTANPAEFGRAVQDRGYHQQAAWYLAGLRALGLAGDDAAFVFVVQEKTAPYLVTVVELDPLALRIGEALNRKAIDLFAACTKTGRWPGYSDDIETVALPVWAEKQGWEEL